MASATRHVAATLVHVLSRDPLRLPFVVVHRQLRAMRGKRINFFFLVCVCAIAAH